MYTGEAEVGQEQGAASPAGRVGAWLVPARSTAAAHSARAAASPARVRVRVLVVLAALSLLMLAAGTALQGNALDRAWMLSFAAGREPVAVQVLWSSLTVAGFGWSCLILLLAADRRDGALVALLLPALPLTGGVTHGLKDWLSTTRPAGSDIGAQLAVIGERIQGLGSTPSGHALAAAAAATLLALWFGSARGARWSLPAIALAGLAVAWSRVMVGAHWPSDVVLGVALGIGTTLIVVLVAGRGGAGRAWQALARASATPKGQRVVAGLEVLAVAGLLITPTGYPLGWPMEALLAALGLGSAAWRWRAAGRLGA